MAEFEDLPRPPAPPLGTPSTGGAIDGRVRRWVAYFCGNLLTSGEFVQPLTFGYNENGNWGYDPNGYPEDKDGGQHTACVHCTNLIHGATCVGFRAVVIGGPSHVGLPAAMPRFILRSTRRVATSLVEEDHLSVTDDSASVAAYEEVHNISVASPTDFTAFEINTYDQSYFWEVRSEGGTNALANFRILSVHLRLQLDRLQFPNTFPEL